MPPQPRRFLDRQSNSYFTYDRESDEYVYENGTRRQRPATIPIGTFLDTPRILPDSTPQQSSTVTQRATTSRSSASLQNTTSSSSDRSSTDTNRSSGTPATVARQNVYGSPTQEQAYGLASGRGNSQPIASSFSGRASETSAFSQRQGPGIQGLSSNFAGLAVNTPATSQGTRPQAGYPDTTQQRQVPTFMQPTQPPQMLQMPSHNTRVSNTSVATVEQFPRQEFERNGLRYVSAYNPRSDVRTTVATAPAERITEPSMLRSGIHAQGMLVGSGTEGEAERLYSTFKVRAHNFFSVGRVFLVLWVEPAGSTVVTGLERGDGGFIPGRYRDELIYSKVRRFVVIRQGDQYCSALPIVSYGHQGVGKEKVKKSEHAIIYTGPVPGPRPMPQEAPKRGEQPMRQISIRVVPDDPTDMLDPESRIDLGKVNTVQHNIKVRPFGMVHQSSLNALHTQFNNVWHGDGLSADVRNTTLPQSVSQRRTSSSAQRAPFQSSESSTRSTQFASGTTVAPSSFSGPRQMSTNSTPIAGSLGRRMIGSSLHGQSSHDSDGDEENSDNDEEEEEEPVREGLEGSDTPRLARPKEPGSSRNATSSRAVSQSSQTSQSDWIMRSVKQVIDAHSRLRREGRSEAESRSMLAEKLLAANPAMSSEQATASINTRFAYFRYRQQGLSHIDTVEVLVRETLAASPGVSREAATAHILARLAGQRQ